VAGGVLTVSAAFRDPVRDQVGLLAFADGEPSFRSARNSAEGFAAGWRPVPVISKTPISEMAPKRFVTSPISHPFPVEGGNRDILG
jgi:hypothetical protein